MLRKGRERIGMQLDSIKHVIATEQEAESIKKKAVTEAEMIKKQAEQITAKNYQIMLEELEKEKQKIADQTILENKEQIEQIQKKANQECETISKKAEQKLQEAFESIWKKVVLNNGNC